MDQSITHSCGHAQRHFIDGVFAADIDRMRSRLTRQRCRQCREGAAATRAAVNLLALGALVLSPLEGSPKQVAWAEKIRAARLLSVMKTSPTAPAKLAEVRDAKWWIEVRAMSDTQLIASFFDTAAAITVSA
jgi:hypothetical protein